MSSVLQIMALPVPPLIVTQSLLLMFMLNFVSLQEILRPGGNTVNNFDRLQFKEPLLPAFVPPNKFNNGYKQGNLYWWPPASSRETPSTLSPNLTPAAQTRFEAYDPKTHSEAPTIKFEEDSKVLPLKSTETTTDIAQSSNVIEGKSCEDQLLEIMFRFMRRGFFLLLLLCCLLKDIFTFFRCFGAPS